MQIIPQLAFQKHQIQEQRKVKSYYLTFLFAPLKHKIDQGGMWISHLHTDDSE